MSPASTAAITSGEAWASTTRASLTARSPTFTSVAASATVCEQTGEIAPLFATIGLPCGILANRAAIIALCDVSRCRRSKLTDTTNRLAAASSPWNVVNRGAVPVCWRPTGRAARCGLCCRSGEPDRPRSPPSAADRWYGCGDGRYRNEKDWPVSMAWVGELADGVSAILPFAGFRGLPPASHEKP